MLLQHFERKGRIWLGEVGNLLCPAMRAKWNAPFSLSMLWLSVSGLKSSTSTCFPEKGLMSLESIALEISLASNSTANSASLRKCHHWNYVAHRNNLVLRFCSIWIWILVHSLEAACFSSLQFLIPLPV